MTIPAAILRAQRASLFGLGNAIYSGPGLGADLPAYDLGAPGVIRELKRALVALASAESDPFKKSAADVATEQTWKLITDDDSWDGPAAEEFLLAISRYRPHAIIDALHISEPYVQQGLPGGPPQPVVNGLELIAGAVRQKIGGVPAMVKYEAWRAQGCTFQATCFAPPSTISKPPDATPVLLTQRGVRIVPSANADPAQLGLVAALDAQQQAVWKFAMAATNEQQRAQLASSMVSARTTRDAAALAAGGVVPPQPPQPVQPGPPVVVTPAETACVTAGGFWDPSKLACTMQSAPPAPAPEPPPSQASLAGPIAILAVLGLGYWWATKKKGGR